MAVTPWPAGGGTVVVVVPAPAMVEVEWAVLDVLDRLEVVAGWWWAGGRNVGRWPPRRRAGTATARRPTRQMTALAETPPSTAHSAGRRRGGQVQLVVAGPSPEAAQRAVPDRLLDEAPGQGGQPDAGGHLEHRPQQVGCGVERGGQHDDRVVPEVDAVGALADPAQRLPSQPAPSRAPGCTATAMTSAVRTERITSPPRYKKASYSLVRQNMTKIPSRATTPTPSSRRRAPGVTVAIGPVPRQGEGQGGPDEEGEGPGVGAVVDAGGVADGGEEEAHLHRRPNGGGQREDDQDLPAAHPSHPGQHDERPHQIELLLDGQRPQMSEWRGRPELGEVGDVLEDVPPVAVVEDARDQVAAHGRQLRAVEERHPAQGDEQHHEERREQAPTPADPELPQPDPAAAVVLGREQIRDEVARTGRRTRPRRAGPPGPRRS